MLDTALITRPLESILLSSFTVSILEKIPNAEF